MAWTHDVVIAGAGLAGSALALLLCQAGIRVALVERNAFPPESCTKSPLRSGRTVALMAESIAVLKAVGAWEGCAPHAGTLRVMRLMDDSSGGRFSSRNRVRHPVELAFSASEIGREAFGYNIPDSVLRESLAERIRALPESICYAPETIESIQSNGSGVDIHLAGGGVCRAGLLVGADGAGSAVRELAGIRMMPSPRAKAFDQIAITCLITHSREHEDTSTEFHRPGGPFAVVPLVGKFSSIVWVVSPPEAERLLHLDKASFTEAIQRATGDILGTVVLESPPESWPLRSACAESLCAPRVALVAEAAHVLPPIAAQGLNLSLRDVAVLAETIVDAARLGRDVGESSVLKDYETRRWPDIITRVHGVNALNAFASTGFVPLWMLRRNALRVTGALPFLRTVAMRCVLAAPSGQGRLLQGMPL